jgi:solute carrier family 25 phosphate transporter 23/24/25/41
MEINFPILEKQTKNRSRRTENSQKITPVASTTATTVLAQSSSLLTTQIVDSTRDLEIEKPYSVQESITSFITSHYAQLKDNSAFKFLLSGGIAGAVSRTATAPLDRVKIYLQMQRGQTTPSMIQSVVQIYREGGMMNFYKGNGTNIVKIAPETGVKFFVYEKMKNFLSKDQKSISPIERFVAGATAGVVAQTTIFPLECVKTRLAIASPGTFKGIIDCLRVTTHNEGFRSLYRGLGPALVGVVPYAGIDLAVYETLKTLYLSHTSSSGSPGVLPLFLCGLTSSTCGQVVAYPLSLVRTRLQAQGMPGHPILYSSSVDAFKKIIKTEGFSGLYKGILPNFLKVAPAVSISYVVYEKVKNVLN